jgi:PAS domain S-box-containing protein
MPPDREQLNMWLERSFLAMPDAVLLADDERRYVFANPAACRLFSVPLEQLLGRRIEDFAPAPPEYDVEAAWRAFLKEGQQAGEFPLRRPDGTQLWLEYRATANVAPGIHLSVLRDVSDRVRERTERMRNEEFRERVIAIVSHDLRGPLGAVLGTAKLLAMGAGAAADRERWIGRIVGSATRMHRMIELLVDWVRVVQLGGFPLRRERLDLGELARTIGDEQAAANPGRAVATSVEGEVAGSWDEARIAQALGNLIGNACQHGTGRVEVAVEGTADAVELRVKNQGDPIPPELLPRIFEPFQQGGAGRTGGGLGLGLFITKQIARAHGGDLFVTSSPEGTCFTLRLPRG